MTAAGAVRRTWKPVGRLVVWQLQRAAAGGAVPATRSFSSVTTNTSKSLLYNVTATIEKGFVRPSTVGAGETWRRSWINSSSSSPHQVRFASSEYSATAQKEQPEGELKKETFDDVMQARNDANRDGTTSSNYWGVTTKEFQREDGTKWQWCFKPSDTYSPNLNVDLHKHRVPTKWDEKLALFTVKMIKIPTVLFYQKRYGCRAMMLETVAAVPGMVGGMLLHLRSLRRFEHSGGWIKALLDEAENERMHLMTLMDVVQPAWYERALVVAVQGVFFNLYFFLYVISPRLAHRVTGYLEEEAIISYTTFLEGIDDGTIENVPAPALAVDYWRLPKDATFRDVVVALRADEAHHRDVNHYAADIRHEGKQLHESPAPVDYH